MKLITCIFVFFCIGSVVGQSNSSWELIKETEVGSHDIWTTDAMGNYIVSRKDRIRKLTSNGEILFDQSIKSLGQLSEVERINALKYLSFSEDQQSICFFDNSLTILEDCIDLADFNILFATHVARSSQSNKIWVYDEVNSTLHLLVMNKLNQAQEVTNLNTLFGVQKIVGIKEVNNRLYCLAKDGGVFVLDLFGTLLQKIPVKNVLDVEVVNDNVLLLTEESLVLYNQVSLMQESLSLPMSKIIDFQIDEQFIYFGTEKKLLKYRFVFNN